MLGPLITIPFVYGVEQTHNKTAMTSDSDEQLYPLTNISTRMDDGAIVESRHFDDGSSIEYAYLLIGLFIAVNAAVFMLLQMLQKQMRVSSTQLRNIRNEKASFKQVLTPSEWADGDGKFGAPGQRGMRRGVDE